MGSYRELETAKYMNLDSESDVSYPPPETSPHLTTANQFASDNTQPASLSSDSQPSPEESSSKGKTWILVIGIALMGLGGMGVFNALNDRGEVPEKREDITTEGTVTDMTATQLKHQIGVTLSTTYRVEYAFRANDGEIYHGEEIIEEGQIEELAQAKPIKVMYHSNNPNLNGAPDYGGYVSVNDLPNTTPNERLKFSAGVLGFGLLLILCAIFIIKPEPTAVQSS